MKKKDSDLAFLEKSATYIDHYSLFSWYIKFVVCFCTYLDLHTEGGNIFFSVIEEVILSNTFIQVCLIWGAEV